MLMSAECFPCFINQALRAVKYGTDDKKIHITVIKEVMNYLASKQDINISPAEYGLDVYRIVRKVTGCNDPFKNEKLKHKDEVMGLQEHLKMLLNSQNGVEKYGKYLRLHNAVKLAGIGNIIDLGVSNPINLIEEIDRVFKQGFAKEDFFIFLDKIKKAKNLLYLTDNSGEIYFDLMFIDELFNYFDINILLGVKGGPVINDITIDDVKNMDIDERIEIISNGTDAIGTVLTECSTFFKKKFNDADVIISKGQANFESLNLLKKGNIFYILKLKCESIAEYTGFNKGDTLFILN
jgi:damage-control phosphatase, subfamily I